MDVSDAQAKLQDLIQSFIRLTEEAEAHRVEERTAAVVLQCAWRRKLVRLKIRQWKQAALDIQRVYRGHVARRSYLAKQEEAAEQSRISFFNRQATAIQRTYRGFRSRKYVHSFRERKLFIAASLDAGQEVREYMQGYNLDMRHEEQAKAVDAVRVGIRHFWQTNHHLIGTTSQNGVFYSPFIAVLKGLNDIEDRIIETRKEKEREAGRRRRRPKREAAILPWAVDVSAFITSEGPCEPTAYERRRAEEKACRLLDVSPRRFRSVVRRRWNAWDVIEGGSTIRMQSEWRRKEILRSLQQRQSQALYLRIARKPFFISPPRQRRFSCGPVPPLGT